MPDERRFLVLLTVGLNSPGVCRAGLVFATLAAASGFRTTIYSVQEGSEIFVKGALDDELPESEGAPTIRQRLDDCMECGIEVLIGEASAIVKGITGDDLIPGARIAGGEVLIELAVEAAGTLSF